MVLHWFGCEWLSSLAPFPADEVDFLGEKVDVGLVLLLPPVPDARLEMVTLDQPCIT